MRRAIRLMALCQENPAIARSLGVDVEGKLLEENEDRSRELTGKERVMVRKVRSDCTVGSFEKSRGLPAGTIRNRDGRDTRSDKKIGTIRKEAAKGKR